MSAIDVTVPRELLSPNKWQGRHWRYKARDTKDWESQVWAEIGVLRGTGRLSVSLYGKCETPQRVAITRLVPSARNFIKDEDNLRFSTKPLNDALKRLGLIKDDSQKWLVQPLPMQLVSTDGKFYTRIQIDTVSADATAKSSTGDK